MTPIAFDGCFGWLHGACGDVGVVMCGSIGFEKQIFHRGWRSLAQRLAEAGFPTLRFDYPGTGDSRGVDHDPEAVAAWLGSIEQATHWLRANTGARRIIFCGIHLGALLAAAAASRIGDVERLVLIAPVLSGRAYARMMQAAAKLGGTDRGGDGDVEAFGLRLHKTTLRALRPLDVARLPCLPAARVLMLAPEGSTGVDEASAALAASGAAVTRLDMPDYQGLTRAAHESVVPDASFARVVAWVGGDREALGEVEPLHAARPIPVAELRLPHAIEHPVLLEPSSPAGREGHGLFGMFCRPFEAAAKDVAVLICNTGANPHYGYGRLGVAMARDLAEDGIASMRIDVAGLGDSDGESTVDLSRLYADRTGELRVATDFLVRRGYDRVVVFGICTGAFHAMHAGLSDPRIAGVVLVNQLVYRWRESSVLLRMAMAARAALRRLRGGAAIDPEQELLRVRIAPPNPAANRIRRIGLRAGVLAELLLLRPMGVRTAMTYPARALRTLAERGVRTLVVAGEDDFARSMVQAQFGRRLRGMARMPGLHAEIEPDFDHPVGSSRARERLIAHVRRFTAGFVRAAPAAGERQGFTDVVAVRHQSMRA